MFKCTFTAKNMKKNILTFCLLILFIHVSKAQAVPPPNDAPANATPLTVVYLSQPLAFVNGTNESATNTFNADPSYGYTQIPSCVPSASQQKDVWFSFNSADFGTSITFTINETGGSPSFGHANLFRLFSTTNCTGASGAGVFTEVSCNAAAGPALALPTFTVSGLTPNTCYFLQMSCYISTGTAWAGFEIAAKGNAAPLPVDIITLEGYHTYNRNVLKWDIQNETNIKYYTLEKMNPGSNQFETIEIIASKNNGGNTYSTSDTKITNDINTYRLRITDNDNKYTYSKTITIKSNNTYETKLYPNPARNVLYLSNDNTDENYTLKLTNISGQAFLYKEGLKDSRQITFDITHLADGIYYLQYLSDRNSFFSTLLKK